MSEPPTLHSAAAPQRLSLPWLVLHWAIILNLGAEAAYAGFMVFVVLRPEGVSGPLFEAALQMPHDLMMVRRAYATESWVALGALSIYVGVTEILPRRLGHRS